LQLQIFLIQLVEVGLHLFDFRLRSAHRQKTVRAEKIVHDHHGDQQAEQSAAILPQQAHHAVFQGDLF